MGLSPQADPRRHLFGCGGRSRRHHAGVWFRRPGRVDGDRRSAGVLYYAAVTWLKALLGYDDALDCFGVHAVGGATGAILTGVFAIKEYGGTAGLVEGNAHQVVNQLIGVAIVAAYDAIVSLLILKLIDRSLGLRVNRDVEIEGLDLTLHGEAVQ